jgi:K+-transporting ATPase KdpF subunit
MNSPLEYILVGIVTLAVLIYLIIALLAPEKF